MPPTYVIRVYADSATADDMRDMLKPYSAPLQSSRVPYSPKHEALIESGFDPYFAVVNPTAASLFKTTFQGHVPFIDVS